MDSDDVIDFEFGLPPKKCIFSAKDMTEFKKSKAFQEIQVFIQQCADSVSGCMISELMPDEVSPVVRKVEAYMFRLNKLIDEIPPLSQPMRYGNKAFKQWYSRQVDETKLFLTDLVSPELVQKGALEELMPYLTCSYGDETRIDYGTGHELNLTIFFLCLYKLKIILKTDLKALILCGFVAYIKTTRKLQTTYFLEPAGSHGVWGLDDYHCLTFLWGSAQLSNHPEIKPFAIHDTSILEQYKSECLYIECISFIKNIKHTAPFAETSPILNDISALEDWNKVCNGLMKLFVGEVLSKVPVVQHLHFGTLLKCEWTPDSQMQSTKTYQNVMSGIATVRPTSSAIPVSSILQSTQSTFMTHNISKDK